MQLCDKQTYICYLDSFLIVKGAAHANKKGEIVSLSDCLRFKPDSEADNNFSSALSADESKWVSMGGGKFLVNPEWVVCALEIL